VPTGSDILAKKGKAEDVAREVGVSKHTIYAWKAKYADVPPKNRAKVSMISQLE